MSGWFDSSLTFAKSAFSQAQKSIDKVLDIDESQKLGENDDVLTSSALLDNPFALSSSQPHPTASPEPPISQSPPEQKQQSGKPRQLQSKSSHKAAGSSTPTPEKVRHSSSGVLGSTWGSIDSYWSSSFSGEGGNDGGNEGKKTKTVSGSKSGRQSSTKKLERQRVQSPGRAGNHQSSSSSSKGRSEKERLSSVTVTSSPSSSSVSSEFVDGGSASSVGGSTDLDVVPSMTSTPLSRATSAKDGSSSSLGSKSNLVLSSSPSLKSSSGSMKGVDHKTPETESIPLPSSGGDTLAEINAVEETPGSSPQSQLAASKEGNGGERTTPHLEDRQDLEKMMGDSQVAPSSSKENDEKESKIVDVFSERESRLRKPQEEPETNGATSEGGGVQSMGESSSIVEDTGTNGRPRDRDLQPVQAPVSEQPGDKIVSPSAELISGTSSLVAQDGVSELQSNSSKVNEVVQVVVADDDSQNADNTEECMPLPLKSTGVQEAPSGEPDKSSRQVEEDKRETGHDRVRAVENCVVGKEDSEMSAKVGLPCSPDHQQALQELQEVRRVLEAREKKMVSTSEELVGLMEKNQSLQEELQAAREMGDSSMEELRSEFTKRISTAEKKLQTVTRERDSLKKQLAALQTEQSLMKKTEGEELNKVLREKEEQVAQLLEEGEKLSKQELQSNSIIKKLRVKERQNDQLMAAQRQQIEDLEGKTKTMKDQLKKKDENERKYQESMGQLNTITEQQAKELTQLKTEKDSLTEKVRSLQANLDNSYRELAELQKTNAVSQSAAQEAAASAEKCKQEELKLILEQQNVTAQREKEALLMQIEELRLAVSRGEQQLAWKEDRLKQEVEDIRKRLQEAEDRNQELTATISQATKPLLRQIENLQSAHSAQSANWEKVESSLTQRLVDAQTQLTVALDKERSAVEKEMTTSSRVTVLENQLSSLRQEKSQLLAEAELGQAKLETLEEGQHRDSAKLETLRASFQQTIDELKKEKDMLERQLEYERVRLEAESRKANLESQEKERLKSQLMHSLNRSMSRQSSTGSQGDQPDNSLQRQSSEYTRSDSTSDLLGQAYLVKGGISTSASALEQLQSMLKQKDGELANMQNLVRSLERSRAAVAEDLTSVSGKYEKVCDEVQQIPQLKLRLEEVEKKHEAILQMYGEKAEEAEELKLDIQDLKLMYRQQITELLGEKK